MVDGETKADVVAERGMAPWTGAVLMPGRGAPADAK